MSQLPKTLRLVSHEGCWVVLAIDWKYHGAMFMELFVMGMS